MLGKPAQELQAFSSAATTPNVAILAMPKRLKDERRLIISLSNLTRSTAIFLSAFSLERVQRRRAGVRETTMDAR